MDTIRLSSLRLQATHGCYDHEKKTLQTFIVDVECVLPYLLGTSDDLSETINYEIIRATVFEIFAQPPCNLIETLAVQIAEKLLAREDVSNISVKIAKPDIWEDSLPSVEITRSK